DSAGNLNTGPTYTLYKDTVTPSLTVDAPGDGTYHNSIFNVQATATDTYFDSVWYEYGGTKYLLTSTVAEPLNGGIWSSLADEQSFTIQFFANDSAGNLNTGSIYTLYKDVIAPRLIVNSPTNYSYLNAIPLINITVFDEFLEEDFFTYTVMGYFPINNDLTNNTAILLDVNIWNNIDPGQFEIVIYSRDRANNIKQISIILHKDLLAPQIDIITPVDLTYLNSIPNIQANVNDMYFDSLWYVIDGTKIMLTNGISEPLDSGIWSSLSDEQSFIIEFYANDSAGNINGSYSLTLFKDIVTPLLTIIAPINNTIIDAIPMVQATAYDTYFDSIWYEVEGTRVMLSNGISEALDSGIWSSLSDEESFIIEFYANDSAGNINNTFSLTLHKDIKTPDITIEIPYQDNDIFGKDAPPFRIFIDETNLNTTWYSLFINGTIWSENIILAPGQISGYIDTDLWNSCNATVIIRFYANDTLGHINHADRIVFRDIEAPVITVIDQIPPNDYVSGEISPTLQIQKGNDVNSTWYSIFINSTYWSENITFTEDVVTIDQAEWAKCGNGTVEIMFYCNDSYGNIGFSNILMEKDMYSPMVLIDIYPLEQDPYCNEPPSFNISAIEPHLHKVWYGVEQGTFGYCSQNISLSNYINQQLDIGIWDDLEDGEFKIYVYMNDTAGNFNYTLISLKKDTSAPQFVINSPDLPDQYSWNSEPCLNITVLDPNLDDSTFICIVRGFWSMSLTNNTNAYIDSDIWDLLGNGEFLIWIEAADTLGHNNRINFTLYKDTSAPIISINSPENGTYYKQEPILNISSTDLNHDTLWYRVFQEQGSVDYWSDDISLINNSDQQLLNDIWLDLNEGMFIIYLFANDTFGYLNDSCSLTFYKDTVLPTVSINSPSEFDLFGSTPPNIIIDISDSSGIVTSWYRLIGDITTSNYPWTGEIDPAAWIQVGNGTVTIRIYANDSAGNVNFDEVIVRKDITPPDIQINNPGEFDLYGLDGPGVSDLDVDFTDPSGIDTRWYRLIGDITTSNYPWTGEIDPAAWIQVGNGTVTIQIYANDSAGNVYFEEVTVRKDITPPDIQINSPGEFDLYGLDGPGISDLDVDFTDPSGIDTRWYRLIGDITTSNYPWTGEIDPAAWIQVGNGTVTIRIYANDIAGNVYFEEVTVRKDITPPDIQINSPGEFDLFGETAPSSVDMDVEITDPSGVDSMWYRLWNGTIFTDITDWLGYIEQADWEQVGNGDITICIYANDTVNNIQNTNITVIKDIDAPTIQINGPDENEKFGINPPEFNITIIEGGGATNLTWYRIWNGTNWSENYYFTGTTGTINQTAWSLLRSGMITIEFWINDILSNEGWRSVTIEKDIDGPIITIISPDENHLCGTTPPSISITFSDSCDINETWYQLIGDDATGYYNWTGMIDPDLWGSISNGTVELWFLAEDKLGNYEEKSLLLRKDCIAPSISIILPQNNQYVDSGAPFLELFISDPNLGNQCDCWYSINGETPLYYFSWKPNMIIKIDQSLWTGIWDTLSHGDTIEIQIFVNDTVGNLGSEVVTVIKFVEEPFDLFKILSGPMGVIITGAIAIGMTPLSIGVVRSRFYKSLAKKDKKKIIMIFLFSFLLLSMILIYLLIP
ncbi:MAG: hypothetical protein ACFFAT_15710, partial [Promethearchaeota archaeon]